LSRDKEAPDFASRWSRLKREAREQDAAPEVAPEPELPAQDDRPDTEVLEEFGLPDPETLKPGDDFAAFMTKAVPARLRNRALRRLWFSDPVLANLDALVDYGDDFTDAATVVENLQTAYEVGRGFAGKITTLAEGEADAVAEPPPDVLPEETPPELPGEAAEAEPDQDVVLAEAAPAPGTREEIAEPAATERKPRSRQRMRFRKAEE